VSGECENIMSNNLPQLEHTSCDLCGQDKWWLQFITQDWMHHQPGKFQVVKCKNCNLVYLNPRPTADSILMYYPDDYEYGPPQPHEIITLRQKLRQAILIRYYNYPLPEPTLPIWVKPWLGLYHKFYQTIALPLIPWIPNGQILDVGCGKGDYLASLRQLGWQVKGIEINPHAVQYARQELNLDILQASFLDNDFPAAQFEVVSMWWYLEHVPNPLEVLREARRVIKPQGRLIIGVPNWSSLEAKLFRSAWYHLDSPRHFYLFTPQTLEAMLIKAGFKVSQTHKLSWFNDPAQSLERWLEITFGTKKSLPRAIRLMLAPLSWLITRFNRGNLLVVEAQADN